VHGTPWIAHFHSTETERQLERADSLTMRIEAAAVQAATQIVVPSNATANAVKGQYAAAADRVHVVPNVLSDEVVPAADMGRFESKRVVFLGRLSRQKGVDRFCQVAEKVQQTRSGVTYEIFGEGEERSSLEYRYAVQWRGALAWDQRSRAFRNTTLLLVPSRAEPFGMVILEAMQHQVPVIYANISGAAEVLDRGVKVNADDIDAMTAQVFRLLNDFEAWEDTASGEAQEIAAYAKRPFEDRLIALWESVL